MPQSLCQNLIHLVFSTKNRNDWILPPDRGKLYTVMATIVADTGSHAYRIGGVSDHVHLAIRLHPTVAGAGLVNRLKTKSSTWMKEHSLTGNPFSWQKGYGLFSVSQGHAPRLFQYIDRQEEHHRKESFQDEYRRICLKNGVELDERYVWD